MDSIWTRRKEKKVEKESQEQDVFNRLMKMAKEDNEKLWDQKYDKYIKKGLSRENARIQTEEKMNSKDLQRFSEKYGQLIQYILPIAKWFHSRKGYGRCKRFPVRRYSERKAIRLALNKNRHVLDEMWENESDMETDEDSESEDKERQDDDNDDSDAAWLTFYLCS